MSLKVLVCGDILGEWGPLFDRVQKVNQKAGPFHLLLVTGNFFPLQGSSELRPPAAPIPTLILGPVEASQTPFFKDLNGAEIAENITYLGRSGVYNEASGLKIAYLSGTQFDGPTSSRPAHQFNFEDVKNLRVRLENESNFKGVDILLTYQWPLGVESHAPKGPESKPKNPSSLLALLAQALKPRYHFSAGGEGLNYERVPYRNHVVLQEAPQHPSRFISLGKVGSKVKFLYAFNITPMSVIKREELIQEPPSVTQNPYTGGGSSSHHGQGQGQGGQDGVGRGGNVGTCGVVKTAASSQFFYDTSYTGEAGRGRGRGRGGKRGFDGQMHHNGKKAKPGGPPSACWFCLASPEVEKHLVVSIGDNAYVTLAKGGLTPDHLLILPIGHYQSLVECPEEVIQDINKYKSALIRFFAAQGKALIFYERNFKSPHLQVQVVPIPKEKTSQGLKILALDFAESEGIEMQDFPENAELFQMTRPGFPYFYMELPDGSKLFSGIKGTFPLQFGREFVASEPLLNCPEKVDWKQCKMSKEEETQCTKDVRESFKPFDFTLG